MYGDQPRNRFVYCEVSRIFTFSFLLSSGMLNTWLVSRDPCLRLLVYCMCEWRFGRLDLYLPKDDDGLKPVVVFVTGGAWIIG